MCIRWCQEFVKQTVARWICKFWAFVIVRILWFGKVMCYVTPYVETGVSGLRIFQQFRYTSILNTSFGTSEFWTWFSGHNIFSRSIWTAYFWTGVSRHLIFRTSVSEHHISDGSFGTLYFPTGFWGLRICDLEFVDSAFVKRSFGTLYSWIGVSGHIIASQYHISV